MALVFGYFAVFITFIFGIYPLSRIISLIRKSLSGEGSDNEENEKAWKSLDNLRSPPVFPIFGHLHHLLRPNLGSKVDILFTRQVQTKIAVDITDSLGDQIFIIIMNMRKIWVSDILKLGLHLAKTCGQVFRIVLPYKQVVIVHDPALVQRVLTSSNPSHLNKDDLYKVVITGSAGDGIIISDYEKWSVHRKIMNRAFTYKSLCHHLSLMNHHGRELVSEVDEFQKTDFSELLFCRILKLVLHTMIESEMFTDDEFKEFHHNLTIGKELVSGRLVSPWQLIPPVWRFHPNRKKHMKAQRGHDSFVENIVRKYRSVAQDKAHSKDMDTVTFETNDVGEKPMKCLMEMLIEGGMSDQDILCETMTMLAAGNETTAYSIIFLLLRFGMMPDIQSRCTEEIDRLYETKENEELTMEDLSNLKYLERCVLESIRIMPIVPVVARRMEAPLTLSEHVTVPQGASILISPYIMHRDPTIYPEPDKFDPDRFLPEACKRRHPCAFIPFSAGSRNCIGWKTAIMTIKVIAVYILRYYRVGTKLKTWSEVDHKFSLTLVMKNLEGILQLDRRMKRTSSTA